jgi:hypothetical protein
MKIKPAIIEPIVKQNLEDQRALTGDALKLGKHELEKTFKARIKEYKLEVAAAWDSTLPLRDAYNKAVVECVEPVAGALISELRHSFQVMDRLFPTTDEKERGDEHEAEYSSVTVTLGLRHDFFVCSPEANEALGHRMWIIERDGGRRHLGGSGGRELALNIALFDHDEPLDDPNFSYDLEIGVAIAIGKGGDEDARRRGESLEFNRTLTVTCTRDLQDARAAFVEPMKLLLAAEQKLAKAEQNLEELPRMIKELDMSATAMRLQAAGGEPLLEQIMRGVQRIADGETELSGLSLALMGTEDDQ